MWIKVLPRSEAANKVLRVHVQISSYQEFPAVIESLSWSFTARKIGFQNSHHHGPCPGMANLSAKQIWAKVLVYSSYYREQEKILGKVYDLYVWMRLDLNLKLLAEFVGLHMGKSQGSLCGMGKLNCDLYNPVQPVYCSNRLQGDPGLDFELYPALLIILV